MIINLVSNYLILLIFISYEQGTAVAIKTLCDIIFTTTNYQRIQQRHLASFYTCVGQILCKPELNIVSHSLLTSSRYIFTQNIFGTSILIPHYLHAISCVWVFIYLYIYTLTSLSFFFFLIDLIGIQSITSRRCWNRCC